MSRKKRIWPIVKKCVNCGSDFSPKRLSAAMFCSSACGLKHWRKNNPEHNRMIKVNWRRNSGVLAWGSIEHREKQAEGSRGNKNRWKGGYQNHLMHTKRRRVLELQASGFHTLEQWEGLKKECEYMCLCCKRYEPEIVLSEDHIVPLSRGGSDDISNIQPLCRSCNSRKYVNVINFMEMRRAA